MYRIQALLLSIILFFVGLIYGDKPIEIDYTVEINGTEISAGESIELPKGEAIIVACFCENVGRPFEGKSLYHAKTDFYKIENGEKKYISYYGGIGLDEESQPILIKSGEKFSVGNASYFEPEVEAPEPGAYTVEVSVYGCKQVFENALIIK
ncbi:MAG: hypothetical protein E7543_07210 [Ruminococcaceae bacterium]|nr:hypothetical protein [Oscillospiraceae bacterium]